MNGLQRYMLNPIYEQFFFFFVVPFKCTFCCVLTLFFISGSGLPKNKVVIKKNAETIPGTIDPDKGRIAMVTPRIQRRIITFRTKHGGGRKRIECLTLSQRKISQRSLGYA